MFRIIGLTDRRMVDFAEPIAPKFFRPVLSAFAAEALFVIVSNK